VSFIRRFFHTTPFVSDRAHADGAGKTLKCANIRQHDANFSVCILSFLISFIMRLRQRLGETSKLPSRSRLGLGLKDLVHIPG